MQSDWIRSRQPKSSQPTPKQIWRAHTQADKKTQDDPNSRLFYLFDRNVSPGIVASGSSLESVYMLASSDPDRHSHAEAIECLARAIGSDKCMSSLSKMLGKSSIKKSATRSYFRKLSQYMSREALRENGIPWGVHCILVLRYVDTVSVSVVGDMSIMARRQGRWRDLIDEHVQNSGSCEPALCVDTLGYNYKDLDVRYYEFSLEPDKEAIVGNADGVCAMCAANSIFDRTIPRVQHIVRVTGEGKSAHRGYESFVDSDWKNKKIRIDPLQFGFSSFPLYSRLRSAKETLENLPLRHDWFRSKYPYSYLFVVPPSV